MLHKTFFQKMGEGATLLLLSTLFLAQTLSAQFILQLPCGSLQIEIVPDLYTGGEGDQVPCFPCCGPTNCQRVRYNVFLRALPPQPGSWNNGNFNMGYDMLAVSVRLKLTNGSISAINEALTEAPGCLADFLENSDAVTPPTLDPANQEVTLFVTNMTGEMPPVIPFQNYRSAQPLFQVFVDGFPGEEFGLDCAELSYSNQFFGDCTNQPGCAGNATSIFPIPTSPSMSVLTLQADCSNSLFMLVPVYASNLPANVNFMDFAVEIATDATNLNGQPQAESFNSGASVPAVTVAPLQTGTGYLLYAKYETPFGGTGLPLAPLFTIRIPRPTDLGETYTVTATLKSGRIRKGSDIILQGFECQSFLHSVGSVQCSNIGTPVCADMWFTVNPSDEPAAECGKLTAYAKLNWNYSSEPARDFESFKVLLEFDLQPGVTISGATVENMACPSSGVACPSGCLSYSGNTVNLCFSTSNGVTLDQNSRIRIDFDGDGGCVMSGKARLVRVKRKDTPTEQYTECRPTLYNMGQFCPLKIEGDLAMENGCYVRDVTVKIESAPTAGECATVGFTANQQDAQSMLCAVPYSKCLCSGHDQYTVTPTKDGEDLNGVSTYDLVLISKHILGLEFLDSPYKIIAADANKSNSVTTADIVEIRKLILGIQNEFPLVNSWRFLPKSYSFLDPSNPFPVPPAPPLPESGSYTLPTTTADFVAIKVGDVNLTAFGDCNPDNCAAFQRPAGEAALSVPKHGMKAGEYYALPIRAAGEHPLVAWQMALRFDPEALELVGPSQGDLPSINAGNFGLTGVEKGLVRALWLADPSGEGPVQAGQTLFHLAFRAKRDMGDISAFLSIDNEALASLGWQGDGTAYALRLSAVPASESREQAAENPMSAACRPNPAAGEVNFDMAMPQTGKVRLSIYGAFGTRVFFREYPLEKGAHTLAVPEASEWPAGVYHWELRRGKERAKGTFIRQ